MRLVLLGEQASGKSSLLVALYGALVNRRAGDLRIVRTDDDVEFLSRGLAAFGRRESVRRTEVDSSARLAIDVSHAGEVVSIEIPDRSGELLRHMIFARSWEPELQRQVSEADGALLFLRADQLAAAQSPAEVTIARVEAGIASLPGAGEIRASATATHGMTAPGQTTALAEAPSAWSPADMPADVRAVDMLQALVEERAAALPMAVIVSAWDLAGPGAASPAAWIAEQVPLVDQFLVSHDGQLPHRTFGVSAQGATFAEETPADAAGEDPWDRAFIVGPDGTPGTLADPIVWLIEAAH
jgi:energy-coupling factor transporter ATP-binding protein EcfA2